jgi:DNA-binding CsgD family transcriptional regulator
MAITREDESELLTALHEGVLEVPLWSTFLQRLRSRTGADYAGLIFHRGDGAAETHESASPQAEALRPRLREQIRVLDPALHRQMRPNRLYTLGELRELGGTPPEGEAEAARIIRISERGGYEAWLMIARAKGDFGAGEGALLSALAPHLDIAIRTYAALLRERLRADISGEVIQRLNFGWITLDAGGHVVDSDDQAERLLRNTDALRRTAAGRLVPASRQAEGKLAQLLRQAATGQPIRSQAIHLSDEPWLDMLVAPVRAQPFARSKAPVLVAYVHGEERASGDREDQLMALFGLTRQEARLAIALSHGRSIAQSAEDLGLTLETTRLYSKRIYAKTGTTGQADLVRLVLASVVALA